MTNPVLFNLPRIPAHGFAQCLKCVFISPLIAANYKDVIVILPIPIYRNTLI